MFQTTTLPKTVSGIAGRRSSVLTFFLYYTSELPLVTDQWELGLSALGVKHCFDRNKGKFTGKFFKCQNAENILALVYIRL